MLIFHNATSLVKIDLTAINHLLFQYSDFTWLKIQKFSKLHRENYSSFSLSNVNPLRFPSIHKMHVIILSRLYKDIHNLFLSYTCVFMYAYFILYLHYY